MAKSSKEHKEFMKQFNFMACCVCGATSQVDGHHRIKQNKGGQDDLNNVVPLCRWDCHQLIHSTNKSQFLREIKNRTNLSNEALYAFLNGNDNFILKTLYKV